MCWACPVTGQFGLPSLLHRPDFTLLKGTLGYLGDFRAYLLLVKGQIYFAEVSTQFFLAHYCSWHFSVSSCTLFKNHLLAIAKSLISPAHLPLLPFLLPFYLEFCKLWLIMQMWGLIGIALQTAEWAVPGSNSASSTWSWCWSLWKMNCRIIA